MRRFLKIFSANSFGIVVAIFGQIFSIPLFLHVWNKQLYGEWLVLTAVPNLLWSIEGGLGVLAANRMTLATSAKDWKGANEIFQTTFLCQLILSFLLYAGTIYAALSTSIATSFGFHIIDNKQASSILLVMMGYMLLGLMLSVYRAAYRACELEARGAMLFSLWRFSDLLIVMLVLTFHGNPVLMADSVFTGILVWIGFAFLDVRRHCKGIHFGFTRISWMRMREMVIHGAPLLMGQLTVAIYMQGYPLVVNRTLGSASVVTLTTLRTICRFGLTLSQTVSYSSSPQLSRSYGAKDWDFFRQLMKVMATAAVWSGIGMTLSLTALGPFILTKWTGGKLTADHLTFCLFALSISVQCVWTCCQVLLTACNKHHLFNYCYCLFTVVALGAAFFLTKPLGFNFIPVVMLNTDVCMVILGLYLVRDKVPESHLRELLCVFRLSFYRNLLTTVLRRQNLFKKTPA